MERSANGKLRRTLGLTALISYGVGDILGAGIYALVGKIAGIAGPASWLAFCVALAVAALTALSYAELGSRFPRSGGESFFCQQAFRSSGLALLVGWLVLSSGVVSLATVSRAFSGYAFELIAVAPSPMLELASVFLFLVILGGINFRGIQQSSRANIVCTVVEAAGLLFVIAVGIAFLATDVPEPVADESNAVNWPTWMAIGQAAAVAFFAFIGFEDMVNVAEEVRSPKRNIPIAIIAALLIAGTVYIAVVWVATAVVPPAELANSQAPLLEVVRRAAPAVPIWSFTTVALFAVANTGLLNFVMASRLLYGMSQQGLVPDWLGQVHAGTKTPHVSIVIVFVAALALASSGTLVLLAGTTSALLLTVFLSVNLALVAIKRRDPGERGGFRIPIGVPMVAAIASAVLICFVPLKSLLSGAVVIALGVVLVLLRMRHLSRSKRQDSDDLVDTDD
jgi:APA family basic amino acid/polyamine antiporter